MDDAGAILGNEFATVALSVDDRGNGPRLRIEDLRTGFVGYLDPLQLETLAWLPDEELERFLDPSYHRWREAGGTSQDGGQPPQNGGPPPLSPSPSRPTPPESHR
jgi:hypothetical protein